MDLAVDLLRDALDAASGRFECADARHVRRSSEHLTLRNGLVDRIDTLSDEGVGVRVRVGGTWGFAATAEVDRESVDAAIAEAVAVATALPSPRHPAPLAPADAVEDRVEPPAGETDPLAVPLADKLALLARADLEMAGEPAVRLRHCHLDAHREEKAVVTSWGTAVTERRWECGGGIQAVAISGDGSEVQTRSYPGSFRGLHARRGWELVEELDLPGHAARVAAEAAALLTAPACPEGDFTVILDGEQTALQVHESVGHAVELDRILGHEASYAGRSWVAAEDVGGLRYGSELMSVTADATLPGGLGSFRVDDEGVPGQALPIVRDGVLVGALSSRETAATIGRERSGGCMRAESWRTQPIVRMTNVNLDPCPEGQGPEGSGGTLRDLIASTPSGLYMATNRSWSIDELRLGFQFATEAAWEVRDGELGRLYRNPSYAGRTPAFWAGLDGVCGPAELVGWGVVNCGKGEPGQVARVTHATVPVRLSGVRVGTAG